MSKKNIPKKSKPLTRKPALPAVLTPENVDKVATAIKLSGKIGSAEAVLGVSHTTIHKWRRKFPKFGTWVPTYARISIIISVFLLIKYNYQDIRCAEYCTSLLITLKIIGQ